MDIERWRLLMRKLGADENLATHEKLTAAYSEPHRHYHTGEHIVDCLDRLGEAQTEARSSEEVELALWFHDAIYKPTSSRNELESAEWASEFLQQTGASQRRCQRVYDHILATKHDAEPPDADARLLVDIDLSILGRDETFYDRFEENVRKEYRWVPWPLYRRKRRQILASFLSRASIYSTAHFRDRYEHAARRNLDRAISALG